MTKGDLMDTIQAASVMGIQLIPPTLLCDSIGSIGLREPRTVSEHTTVQECVSVMQTHHVGSLLVTNPSGVLVGIFTERDCLMKVIGKVHDLSTVTVKDFMTPDPVSERPDASLAFALNLMSNGGFRHIPIVDSERVPLGVISIKDVVNYIVSKMLKAINDAVEGG